jgi:hypothetical protein
MTKSIELGHAMTFLDELTELTRKYNICIEGEMWLRLNTLEGAYKVGETVEITEITEVGARRGGIEFSFVTNEEQECIDFSSIQIPF